MGWEEGGTEESVEDTNSLRSEFLRSIRNRLLICLKKLSSTLNWSYKTSEGFWVYARFGFNFATTKIAPGSGIFFIRIRKIWIRFCNNRNRARIRYFFIRIRNTGLTWPVNVATVCCSPCRSTGQTRTPWRCSCRPRSRGWWQRRWSCPRSRGSSLHNVRLSYFENLKVY